jgi:hypothetical protein
MEKEDAHRDFLKVESRFAISSKEFSGMSSNQGAVV